MRVARLAFVVLASSWILLLLAAPVSGLGVPASGAVYAFASVICHQRPQRSFHIEGAQLPVCARCFGIYAGAALGLLAGLRPGATAVRRAWGVRTLRAVVIVAAIPTAITWGSEAIGLWSPANVTRFFAAVPLGAAVAVTVNYVGCVRPQPTGPNSPRILI